MKDSAKINAEEMKEKEEKKKQEKLIKKADLNNDNRLVITDNSIYEYDLDCLKRKKS